MKIKYCLILFLLITTVSYGKSSDYFSIDYNSARSKFRSSVASFKDVNTKAFPIENEKQDLTVDAAFFPALKKTKSLLILLSGVHGVEAYAGSAIQLQFLDKTLPELSRENLGVLLVHSLNPYGFMHNRRVDQNNIDLNRNFAINDSHFKQKNQDYLKLKSFLNPEFKASTSIKNKIAFYANAIFKIIQSSIKSLRAATLKGQFEVLKGIFFGGKKPQTQTAILKDIVSSFELTDYENVLTVDLHTGYGERGKLHYFSFLSKNSQNQKFLNDLFKDYSVDLGSDEDFYKVTGDSTVFMESLFSDVENHAGMTFEFGTLDSQTSMGAIESLRRIILENQGHHYGYQDKKSEKNVKSLFLEMFNPSDLVWREAVLNQANNSLNVLIPRLEQY